MVKQNQPPSIVTMEHGRAQKVQYLFLLQSLLFVGIGIVAGYGVFFVQWHSQCATLLLHSNNSNNECYAPTPHLDTQHDKSGTGSERFMQYSDACQDELAEKQVLLDQNELLKAKHHDLYLTHQATVQQLQKLQVENERNQTDLQESLQEQVYYLQGQLAFTSQQALRRKLDTASTEESLRRQLELSQSLVAERDNNVGDLLGRLAFISQQALQRKLDTERVEKSLRQQLEQSQSLVKERETELTKLERKLSSLLALRQNTDNSDKTNARHPYWTSKIIEMEAEGKQLQTTIQKQDLAALNQNFGRGPYEI